MVNKIFHFVSIIFILSFLQSGCNSKKTVSIEKYVVSGNESFAVKKENNSDIKAENKISNENETIKDINYNTFRKSCKKTPLDIDKQNINDNNNILLSDDFYKTRTISREVNYCNGDIGCINRVYRRINDVYSEEYRKYMAMPKR